MQHNYQSSGSAKPKRNYSVSKVETQRQNLLAILSKKRYKYNE